MAALGVAVTALLLAATASAVKWNVATPAEFAAACQSMSFPDFTLVSLLVLALGSLAFSVIAMAMRSAMHQWRGTRGVVPRLHVVDAISCESTSALVFQHRLPQAFCAGLLRPRIFISTAAVAALGTPELRAVVAHEAHHARFRDPLRVAVARVLGDALFFLPALRCLGDRYAALAELAADEAAVANDTDRRRALAAALLVFEGNAAPAGVGIAPERVDHLLGKRPAWELPLALLAWAAVVLTALAVVALRAQDTMGQAQLELPALAAHACMLVMVLGPLAVGAAALLAGRRWARGRTA